MVEQVRRVAELITEITRTPHKQTNKLNQVINLFTKNPNDLGNQLGDATDLLHHIINNLTNLTNLLNTNVHGTDRAKITAQAHGLRTTKTTTRPKKPIFNNLKKILNESNVLLTLTDPQIYNSNSIQKTHHALRPHENTQTQKKTNKIF